MTNLEGNGRRIAGGKSEGRRHEGGKEGEGGGELHLGWRYLRSWFGERGESKSMLKLMMVMSVTQVEDNARHIYPFILYSARHIISEASPVPYGTSPEPQTRTVSSAESPPAPRH
jgi:hypothetical protein